VTATETEEIRLEVTPGPIRSIPFLQWKAENVRLAYGPAQVAPRVSAPVSSRQCQPEIGDRPERRGDRNPIAKREVRGQESGGPMDSDPAPPPPSAGVAENDVHWSVAEIEKPPEGGRAFMADRRGPRAQHGAADRGVAEGEH